jgi:DNA-binding NtrC family response regulator
MRTPERVLVVDDDPDVCQSCAAVLREEGYETVTADSAAEALRVLREQRPDLVILDVMMEEADSGFRVAETIARECPGLPVLLLSSIVDAAAQVFDLNQLPVSEFANKPMRPGPLRLSVRRLLDKAKAHSSGGG